MVLPICKDDLLADGPSTEKGEIALGRNALIGFMNWEGYNYEDAVLLSEKLVKEDIYTSIHMGMSRVISSGPRKQAGAGRNHPRHPERRRGRGEGSR